MNRNAILIGLSILMLLLLELHAEAQCSNARQVLDYQSRIMYREHTQQGMLNNTQWDKALVLGHSYFSAPYFAGFLETDFIKGWELIDITDVRSSEAIIVAVSSDGRIGHSFYDDYRYIPKKDLMQERIRKIDLKFYNDMLHAGDVNINSATQALDLSLLLLKVSTHRARGFFIQLINSPSDIPKLNDNKKRFGGIVRESIDEASESDFRIKLSEMSKTVTPPYYSEHDGKYDLSFFTWDPVFGDVEQWCVTVTKNKIENFTRKLAFQSV